MVAGLLSEPGERHRHAASHHRVGAAGVRQHRGDDEVAARSEGQRAQVERAGAGQVLDVEAAGAEARDGRKADAPAEAVTEGKKPRVAPAAAGPAAAPQARKKPER